MGAAVVLVVLAMSVAPAGAAECSRSWTHVFAAVSRSVVAVEATVVQANQADRAWDTTSGAGVVISPAGEILTSAHLVNHALSITVTPDKGEPVRARLVGLDPVLDLAVLGVSVSPALPAARLGESAALHDGDDVSTIGSPAGFDRSMTHGIVSAVERRLPGAHELSLIQVDAAINPGDSGGPLMDACGRVVGINTLLAQDTQGIGFAVPIDAVKDVLDDLRRHGRVVRPWLGLYGREVDEMLRRVVRMPLPPGFLIEVVHDASPATGEVHGGTIDVEIDGRAYLLGGDVLTAIAGHPVKDEDDYDDRVSALTPGQRVTLSIVRDGQPRTVTITVAERPRLPSDLVEQAPSGFAQARRGRRLK